MVLLRRPLAGHFVMMKLNGRPNFFFSFSFSSQVNVEWGLPAVVCDFYIAMDVTCSTSSIFNLVAISIDR